MTDLGQTIKLYPHAKLHQWRKKLTEPKTRQNAKQGNLIHTETSLLLIFKN